MEIVYIPEVYFYSSLIVGILSSLFICLDLYFKKKKLATNLKWTWALFAIFLFWGPSFLLWIIYEIKYKLFTNG